MNKSNIFVYIELTKLVSNLSVDIQFSKQYLKSQAGYFKIIPARYFSDTLRPEWESIVSELRSKAELGDKAGREKSSAFLNAIERMTPGQCVDIVLRINSLYNKVKLELEFT